MSREYYKIGEYSLIDIINNAGLNFNKGNILKYVFRRNDKHKSPVECLNKALHYVFYELKRIDKVKEKYADLDILRKIFFTDLIGYSIVDRELHKMHLNEMEKKDKLSYDVMSCLSLVFGMDFLIENLMKVKLMIEKELMEQESNK